jgi:hypothetical protein
MIQSGRISHTPFVVVFTCGFGGPATRRYCKMGFWPFGDCFDNWREISITIGSCFKGTTKNKADIWGKEKDNFVRT